MSFVKSLIQLKFFSHIIMGFVSLCYTYRRERVREISMWVLELFRSFRYGVRPACSLLGYCRFFAVSDKPRPAGYHRCAGVRARGLAQALTWAGAGALSLRRSKTRCP